MNQQDINDPLTALREELADVSPSPEFVARVRQGIDASADARRAGWLSGWRWLVPATAVAAVILAVVVASRPGPDAPEQVSVKTPVIADAPRAKVPRAVAPPGVVVHSPRTPKSELSVANVEAAFPEVITNQPEILRALWARVDSKAALVESVAKTSPDTVLEIVVNPIEVSPIVIKWLGDPQTAPGAPIIRRVTADRAERSEK